MSSRKLSESPLARQIASSLQQIADLPRWWLSFCDPDKTPPPELQRPGGPSFLGVAIIRAPDYISAIEMAHALGCNPGGQVNGVPVPPDIPIPDDYLGRLLTKTDVEYLDTLYTEGTTPS